MAILIGEAHDLVLDGRAVARPTTLDLAGVHRRPMQVGADEFVNRLIGIGNVAIHLRLFDAPCGETKRPGFRVAGL